MTAMAQCPNIDRRQKSGNRKVTVRVGSREEAGESSMFAKESENDNVKRAGSIPEAV